MNAKRSRRERTPTGFRWTEILILGLFFFSGASALVYEVVWTRDLTYVFGGSAFAIATVLAAFMAGLALGSKTFGNMIDRRGHPLKTYAVLEVGIAGSAVALPVLFGLLDHLYAGIYRAWEPGFQTLGLIRFALTFLVLLIPTTMMGGTLPVLGKLLIRSRETTGLRAGVLYFSNTLGAVVGVAGGGFVLLPSLGLHGATMVAVVINVAVALIALVMARFVSLDTDATPVETARASREAPTPALRRIVLIVYAASGLAALALEVAWTKTLSMVLGTTTYAFTTMLTTFLLGLSLGSAVFARVADRIKQPVGLLLLIQAGIAITALVSIPMLGRLPQLYVDGFATHGGSWVRLELFRFLLAASIMMVPAVLMGATFPLVSRVYLGKENTGSSLGSLYAANTMGAILGSFATGFVLLPLLGRQYAILIACSVNVAAVLLLLGTFQWKQTPALMRAATALALIGIIPAFLFALKPWDTRVLASGAYVYANKYAGAASISDALSGDHLIFYDEGTEGTVSVWQREYQTHLRINGKVDASSHGDMITQKLLAHLPAFYHQGEPKQGLVIGLGSGVSVGSLLSHDLESVETVELIPGMTEAARHFENFNGKAMDDPRHRVIVNDGRNHLRLTDKTYDIIVSEPSNPWIAGIGSLFTREFFETARTRLNPGGVLSQWVQVYDFNEDDLKTIFATMSEVFPHVHIWMGSPGDLILLASETPLRMDGKAMERALGDAPGDDLASVEILPMAQLLGYYVTDEEGVNAFAGSWPGRVTDDNLYLEYAVPRHMVDAAGRVRFSAFQSVRKSPVDVMTGVRKNDLAKKIARYQIARDLAYGAHYEKASVSGEGSLDLEMAFKTAPNEHLTRKLWTAELLRAGVRDRADGKLAASAASFRKAARTGLREQQATALLYLGSMAYERGEKDMAAKFWRRCLEKEPRYPDGYFYLGGLEAAAGRYDEALALVTRATELAPAHTQAWVRRSELHAQREEWVEAEACLEKAMAGNPDGVEARMVRGVVSLKAGELKDAVSCFEHVIERKPDKAEAVYNLAVALEELRRYPDAAAAWSRYLELRPTDARAANSLAWILATQLERAEEAETLARKALASGTSANYLDTLAESLHRQNKNAEAVEAARKAAKLENTDYYREQLSRFQQIAGSE